MWIEFSYRPLVAVLETTLTNVWMNSFPFRKIYFPSSFPILPLLLPFSPQPLLLLPPVTKFWLSNYDLPQTEFEKLNPGDQLMKLSLDYFCLMYRRKISLWIEDSQSEKFLPQTSPCLLPLTGDLIMYGLTALALCTCVYWRLWCFPLIHKM